MKKIKVIAPIVFFLGVISLLYFLNSKQNDLVQNKDNEVDLKQMEESYKNDSKDILADYQKAVSENPTEEQIKQIKESLLNLKVPTEFKNLHLNLFLAMNRMENFIKNGEAQEKIASQQIINQIKADYAWIN